LTRPERARPTARSGTAAEASRELAVLAGREAIDHKGREVMLLDLRGLTSATDWFVLASGESDVQVRAIAERIEERLRRDREVRPWHVEGLQHARWVLLDYVDFVVHVFHREARDYYQLERLWADAPSESIGEVRQS
jgi:ribosome-associated protein